jgi:NADH-quinone oxidoreductase subunit E
MTQTVTINPKTQAEIEQWLKKYPKDKKQSAVLQALMFVQRDNGGWLSEAHLNAVADYLELPRIAVYEVATFYDMYDLKPVGKNKIDVCTNISCKLCGCDKIVSHIEKRLGIKIGETTADGRFSLKGVECLAACVGAPMMQVNDHEYHEKLTPEKVDAILDRLEKQEANNG